MVSQIVSANVAEESLLILDTPRISTLGLGRIMSRGYSGCASLGIFVPYKALSAWVAPSAHGRFDMFSSYAPSLATSCDTWAA